MCVHLLGIPARQGMLDGAGCAVDGGTGCHHRWDFSQLGKIMWTLDTATQRLYQLPGSHSSILRHFVKLKSLRLSDIFTDQQQIHRLCLVY